MPQRKYPRIEIDQRAYDALQAEGILQHRTVREIATEAILGHISTEAIEFIDRKTKGPKTAKDECGAATVADKRKRLADNPEAIAKIKELWQAGERNQAEISRHIGYHRATVNDNVQRLKKAGELSD